MNLHFGLWDILLVLVVSSMATILAYLKAPRWKAFMLLVPIPFTMAALAVGKPIDASNVLGTLDLMLFGLSVYYLHIVLRLPIVAAIAACLVGYCAIGTLLARLAPASDVGFWLCLLLAFAASLGLRFVMRPRAEPHYRSPLPLYYKAPIIAAIVICLVILKKNLGGFVTTFPFVTTMGVYEARKSLWTVTRELPLGMLAILPMLAALRLLQDRLGLAWSLPIAWGVYIPVMASLLWAARKWEKRPEELAAQGAVAAPVAGAAAATAPVESARI